MKRITSIAVIAVALAGLAAACAQTSSADVTMKHLTIVGQDTKAKTNTLLDLGKKGFSPGDVSIEEAPINDTAGKAIGTSYTTVAITSGTSPADVAGLVDCSINLAGGTIIFNGAMHLKDLPTGVTLPVVGGSGAYLGAGGTVRMSSKDMKTTRMVFDLLIPKTS